MKKLLLVALLLISSIIDVQAQSYEYKIITTVESIVPMGIGRSRIISSDEERYYKQFTTLRSETNKKQNKTKRSEAKINQFEETKLVNFYSVAGINFRNIASNDALMSSKINSMISEGWDLAFVTSGVESDSGKGDGKGIYITRYIFKRLKQS